MTMIPETQPGAQAAERPARDRFILMDDGSAIAESKHGTFYAMQFFDRPGETIAVHCDCPFVPKANKPACRHRRKLRSLLLAPARIEKAFGSDRNAGCEILDDADTPVVMETECGGCGEFMVDCFARVRPAGYRFGGQLHLAVCGCGVKYGGAFLTEGTEA